MRLPKWLTWGEAEPSLPAPTPLFTNLTNSTGTQSGVIKVADLNALLNRLRADESLAPVHAYTILARVKSEINQLGAGA
jgi:hypothetical protein